MAEILLVTWDGGGNVNPLLRLRALLADAGHGVRALGPASLASRFPRAFTAHGGGWGEDLAGEVADECRRVPTDAAVVDYMMPAALAGAECAGVPAVAFVHTLWTVAVAPTSPMLMAGDLGTVNGLRSSLGLDAVSSPVELLARSVVTTVDELDGGGPYPEGVTLVGPLADVGPPAAGGPVVVANLGTTPMDEGPVLTRLIEALGALGEPALVTVGSHLDPAAFPAPAGVTVSGCVPHASVLPGARLFVSHGGLSGIGAALAHGVPMVCVPLGRDQPDNAARVAAVGAGLLRPGSAPAAELHAAMATVLRDPSFAAAAGRLRDAIPAPPVAVAAIEAVLR